MSTPNDAQRCDSCKIGSVIRGHQQIAFHQWTDKGYVFCHATIPIGVCSNCGSKSWDEAAEAIIEEVARQEYEKLP
jgi:hypothetical protein